MKTSIQKCLKTEYLMQKANADEILQDHLIREYNGRRGTFVGPPRWN